MTKPNSNQSSINLENLEETIKTIGLNEIELNQILQARLDMKSTTVKDYEKAYANGANFPPLLVAEINDYKGRSVYLLLDGWHRYQAMVNISWEHLVNVRSLKIPKGTPIEHLIFLGGRENLKNGLNLSTKDKRELFRAYVKGKHNKKGRSYKSYREIASVLQFVSYQTLHTWMQKDFPATAIQMRMQHKEEITGTSKATGTGHVLTAMPDLSSKTLGLIALDVLAMAKASDDVGREDITKWLNELVIALRWEAPFTASNQQTTPKDKVNKLTLKDDTFFIQ
ncbi:MAG: hypothetical protein V4493_03305 [Pseudomonadota bacterium]